MIYLDNNTEVQTIYIPRNDGAVMPHHGGEGYDEGFADGKAYQKSLLASTAITANGIYEREDGYDSVNVNVMQRPFARLKKVEDYLYYTEYDELDYDNAYDYFSTRNPSNSFGGCSAFRLGNNVGRNYDWLYDNEVSFVVKTPSTDEYKATLGVCGSVSRLTKQMVESGEIIDEYKILPFFMQDGINEDGLFCEMNVVPSTGFKKTVPTISKIDSVCILMLVRYILDRYESVYDAIESLQQNVEIYQSKSLELMGYEVHLLLADENTTKVIEFIGDEIKVINIPVSTNFHIYGVDLLEDNTVYTPEDAIDGNYPSSLGIEDFGSGLERWNMIVTASTSYTVRELLNSLYYSNAYTNVNDVWYSEFVGGSITVDTPSNNPNFQSRISEYRQKFIEKDRNRPDVWITTHSCIYNIEDKSFTITSQEGSSEHEFSLDERILPSLQDKYVSINQTSTMVYPDSGYDGMSSVEVNTTEFEERIFNKGYSDGYTTGYTEGYTSGNTDGYFSGYTSGETHQKSLMVSTAITQNGTFSAENGFNSVTVNVADDIDEKRLIVGKENGIFHIYNEGPLYIDIYHNGDCIYYYDNIKYSGSTLLFKVWDSDSDYDDNNGKIEVYSSLNGGFVVRTFYPKIDIVLDNEHTTYEKDWISLKKLPHGIKIEFIGGVSFDRLSTNFNSSGIENDAISFETKAFIWEEQTRTYINPS